MNVRRIALAALLLLDAGCSTINSATSSVSNALLGTPPPAEGQPGHVTGFLGGVVADEPRAALAGREVLSAGGNAADAAVAVGFALAVTLPSRAGIGGAGACLAYAPGKNSVNGGTPEAILFTPAAAGPAGPGVDRPAALPLLARGLFLLHVRYGRQPFESLTVPAEQMARFGVPVSRALASDIAQVSGPLFADPQARTVFSRNGAPLAPGDTLSDPDLGITLAQLRTAGVGDLYQGQLADRLSAAAPTAGAAISAADLRRALPQIAPAVAVVAGRDRVAFLPPPADGGLAAAAAFGVLAHNPAATNAAQARALAVLARFRAGGIEPQAVLLANIQTTAVPPLPASTSFVTMDRDGNAVACALTMDNLFGTGRIVPGMGFLLAASPADVPPPMLAAAIAWNDSIHAFRAAVSGSGQEGAALAVAAGMTNTLRTNNPMPVAVPDPGRANVIACPDYVPGDSASCRLATDPRGMGLAAGGG